MSKIENSKKLSQQKFATLYNKLEKQLKETKYNKLNFLLKAEGTLGKAGRLIILCQIRRRITT